MLLIDNIGCLATLTGGVDAPISQVSDAAVLVEGEKIFWCGKKSSIPKVGVDERIDAEAFMVIPGLIDCHSHLVFAGTRADEFAARSRGETYQAIMKRGGGILSTVSAVRQSSDQELMAFAFARAGSILAQGVTTLEAKSGYGLSVDQELRVLRLLKALNDNHRIDIHATFLGAHVVPEEYRDDRERYLKLITEEMMERVVDEDLAKDCDVFCDTGAFSVHESELILTKAHGLGMGLRAHLNQLSNNGGISLVASFPIKSISHADHLSTEDIAILAKSSTVVEVLPFAALFLRSREHTPVEALNRASVKLAIATDFNPGSAMCHDLVLAARLAVTLFGFTVDAALYAITANAAISLGRSDIGRIVSGNLADLVITNCHDINEFFYDWTKHPVKTVIKRGKPII